MLQEFILSFNKNISLIEDPDKELVVLQSPNHKLTFKQVKTGFKTALKTLATNGATSLQLSHLVQDNDGVYEKLKFYHHLQKFSNLGWICYSVFADEFLIATALPVVSDYQLRVKDVTTHQKYMLSRFAYCHQVEGQLLLESPLSKAQVLLFDWRAAALIALLSRPHNYSALAAQISGIKQETTKQFISLLLSTQMLSEVQEDGITQEMETITLLQWEFHDLLFHTRSRKGRQANPYGASYRFLGQLAPLPAIKPRMSSDIIDLYKPDIKHLKSIDVSFTHVLEVRESIREYGEKPLTVKQLGEFLYRCARVRNIRRTEYGELSNRPYPGGGALYELELYIVVNICESLPSGLYHYISETHQLCKISGRTDHLEELLTDAWRSMGQQYIPQVLIIMAARFQRLAWKYESIAYATVLKNVGVLYQTMYLVATAMKLAPCGLGGGNSDLFAKAAGTDYYAETSVGEFALGSKRQK
jgi:oxazoline/thiazoline dehydrogenase